MVELTTVADDFAVLHDGLRASRLDGLEPATEYTAEGVTFRTLERPGGQRLATIATVNDLHFGEQSCGVLSGADLGPVLSAAPGEAPYPETMNGAAAAEIAGCEPDAVIAKGDLTAAGRPEELQAFFDCYQRPFGERLSYVKGNHDVINGDAFAAPKVAELNLPGVVVALLDTAVPGQSSGALEASQLGWLDELAARADRPVMVFGHHHCGDSAPTPGLDEASSDALVEVVARREAIVGYFAGHTHRNRVQYFDASGPVPFVEVSATKDFPGGWAEYRVFEGGILQVFHRISSPEALAWTERTRQMFGGLYPAYSFGTLEERCFPIRLRRSSASRVLRPTGKATG